MSNLNEAIKSINKELGEGTINELSKFGEMKIERISSGSFAIDEVMGQGVPISRILEIYGEPSSGKSVLSFFMIAEIQKQGKKAAYIDCEQSFSPIFAKGIGVDTDKLIFSQAVCMEDVLNLVNKLVETGELSLIVIDSVAAMIPQAEINGSIGEMQVALQARIMSQALRKLTSAASKSNTAIVFINQTRQKIGQFFGNPSITTGGTALRFYSSIRLLVKKGKNIEENGEVVGNYVKIECTKNKTAAPFKEAEFALYYRTGIDKQAELLDYAVKYNLIEHKGNTFSYADTKIGVGREQSIAELKSNTKLYETIAEQLKNIYYNSNTVPQEIKEEEETKVEKNEEQNEE
jgi:recombination protein RecA